MEKEEHAMEEEKTSTESFAFMLIRLFLATEADQMPDLQPVSDKEFYPVLAILVVGVVVLALTIGPFAVRW